MGLVNQKLSKLSVLIVEDMKPAALLMRRMLFSIGIGEVMCAQDAEEAFDLFCKRNFDIIITDWHMPGMSGVELLSQVRRSSESPNKVVPVIMTTGYSAAERIMECRDAGVTDFLVKPFKAEDLIKRLAHAINSPKDFIDSDEYFGPDRRRKIKQEFTGTHKRSSDPQYVT